MAENLIRVITLTGADDSVKPSDLLVIENRYSTPLSIEWGILASKSQMGNYRFPSEKWLNELKPFSSKLNLSLHLCGKWVRDLLIGELSFDPDLVEGYQRIQLNFHAERTECNPQGFAECLDIIRLWNPDVQFIFQIDGAQGNKHLDAVRQIDEVAHLDLVPLFDVSGGAGIVPKDWPEPLPGYYFQGYAGGLGPDNLHEEIVRIKAAATSTGSTPRDGIWIDMETRIRSNNDRLFDLDKVDHCIRAAISAQEFPKVEVKS